MQVCQFEVPKCPRLHRTWYSIYTPTTQSGKMHVLLHFCQVLSSSTFNVQPPTPARHHSLRPLYHIFISGDGSFDCFQWTKSLFLQQAKRNLTQGLLSM